MSQETHPEDGGSPSRDAFWEQTEQVARFAAREADHRLLALLPDYAHPSETRVLDLGCAGGRNTVALAERGFDVHALDASAAMVACTRARLTPLVGAAETARRVTVGRMDDLGRFADGSFELIVALGIYHCAADETEWHRAVAETARVTARGGRLLVAHFTPRTDPSGQGTTRVAAGGHVYLGFPSGPHVLMEAPELDEAMRGHGFVCEVTSETVSRPTDTGRRVTVNALYRNGTLGD